MRRCREAHRAGEGHKEQAEKQSQCHEQSRLPIKAVAGDIPREPSAFIGYQYLL
jgi:hypothetical protein